MSEQQIEILIEIPYDLEQQEIWNFEEKLSHVKGVTTDLHETKDLNTSIMLVLHFAASIMGPIAVIGGGIKSIHDVAKILYDFLHTSHEEKNSEVNKKKVVIIKDKTGKRTELFNLSIEEIEKLLKEQ